MKKSVFLGVIFLLTLITSAVFGNISENSRQGFSEITEFVQPVSAFGDVELHPVSGRRSYDGTAGAVMCDKHGKRKCGKCNSKTIAEEYGYLPGDWKRVSRKADGETYISIFDGDDESHEYQVKNNNRDDDHRFGPRCPQPKPKLELVREFIGGPGTDDLEVTKYRGRSLSMLKDALGSTIALTNRGGNAVAKIGYDAWGNLTWPDKPGHGVPPCRELDLGDLLDRLEGKYTFGGPLHDWWHHGRHFAKVLTPYLYASRRLDAFTGNYNNRNRYYSPRYGRFVSRDPIGFNGGNNLWGYAHNNPILESDPDGRGLIASGVRAIINCGKEPGDDCYDDYRVNLSNYQKSLQSTREYATQYLGRQLTPEEEDAFWRKRIRLARKKLDECLSDAGASVDRTKRAKAELDTIGLAFQYN